jgi:hypothetical protein
MGPVFYLVNPKKNLGKKVKELAKGEPDYLRVGYTIIH